MLYDDLVPHGDYICHHGIKGQKWGVRKDKYSSGSFRSFESTSTSRKQRHKDYKIAKKEAYKEYKKKLKESGVNNFFIKSRSEAMKREAQLDEWVYKKSKELFEQYKGMKAADAIEKGKDLKNLVQVYFNDYRATPSGSFLSTEPAIVNYQYMYDANNDKTYYNKHIQRYRFYYIP
jgi:hypothetical protein